MKDKEKRLIAILVVITIILIIVAIVRDNAKKDKEKEEKQEENQVVQEEYVQLLEDGTKFNTSNKLKETKIIEGMELTNIQLTEKDNETLLLGTLTNVSDTTQGGYLVDVKIVDREGNEITDRKSVV